MDVGFIGLGMMGSAMARNLAKAGHAVKAWNRSKVDAAGLTLVKTAAEAFAADAVFTMLADDAAVRAVVLDGDLLKAARKDTVHVGCSTISVAFAEELAEAHRQAGIGYISAPVFGRPNVAEAAQLNVLVGGEPSLIERVAPLLAAIGRKTWPMGEMPAQANAAKIAGNMMIAMAIEAMAEASLLTERNGVAPKPFFELMLGTLFAGRVYESYSAQIAAENYEPGFKMKLGLKDLRLATEAAELVGKKLPMLDAVRSQMDKAVQAGFGEQDWTAVAAFMRQRKR